MINNIFLLDIIFLNLPFFINCFNLNIRLINGLLSFVALLFFCLFLV